LEANEILSIANDRHEHKSSSAPAISACCARQSFRMDARFSRNARIIKPVKNYAGRLCRFVWRRFLIQSAGAACTGLPEAMSRWFWVRCGNGQIPKTVKNGGRMHLPSWLIS